MSELNQEKSFFDLYADGYVMEDEVDDYIDLWHDSKLKISLNDFLGLSEDEYSIFLVDASALPYILQSRVTKRPLQAIMASRLEELTVAARSSDKTARHAIKLWIDERKKRT